MSQTLQIRDYIDTHPAGLTPLEALDLFGCFRLGARVLDIKRGIGCDPLDIATELETRGGKSFARYRKANYQDGRLF